MPETLMHYLYCTTNTQTGRYYVGRHSSKRLEDPYLGSGTILARAIKKYGRSSFRREILYVYSSYSELIEAESALVEFVVADPLSYNVGRGGFGGSRSGAMPKEVRDRVTEGNKNNKYRVGCKHTEETKEKIRLKRVEQSPTMLGKHHTEETKAKLRKNHNPASHANRPPCSEETKAKISAALKMRNQHE